MWELPHCCPCTPYKWCPSLHPSASTAQVLQADITPHLQLLVEPSRPQAPASKDKVPLGGTEGVHAAGGAALVALVALENWYGWHISAMQHHHWIIVPW